MKSKVKDTTVWKKSKTCERCGGKMDERIRWLRNYTIDKIFLKCVDCGYTITKGQTEALKLGH